MELKKTAMATSYSDWIAVSEIKATLDVLATQHQIEVDTQYVNEAFVYLHFKTLANYHQK